MRHFTTHHLLQRAALEKDDFIVQNNSTNEKTFQKTQQFLKLNMVEIRYTFFGKQMLGKDDLSDDVTTFYQNNDKF